MAGGMGMKTSNRRISRAVLLTTILGLVGCGQAPSTAASPSAAPVSITVGLPLALNLSLPVYVVAKEKGFFTRENLDVTYQSGTAGIQHLGMLQQGKAQFISFDVLEQCKVLNQSGFKMLSVFATEPRTFLQVFGLASRGWQGNADLKGKKIGVTSLQSGTMTTAKTALLEGGLGTNDAEFIPVGDTRVAALLSGRVDVLSAWDQIAAAIEAKGQKVYQFSIGAYQDVPGNTIFTTPDYAQSHPDEVRRFVAALQKAEKWTYEHQDDAIKVILDALPSQSQDRDLATAQLKARMAYYGYFGKGKTIGLVPVESAQRGVDALVKLGALQPCDLKPGWTDKYLSKVSL
jgi:NitT/TauT family transport system substrate-binding protein